MWMIFLVLGITAVGSVYGYSIGKLGMRHSWSLKKIKIVAAGPPLFAGALAVVASLAYHIFYERPGPDSFWGNFPWVVLVLTGMLAMFGAAKGAGVAWVDFKNGGRKISDGKNDLSIT